MPLKLQFGILVFFLFARQMHAVTLTWNSGTSSWDTTNTNWSGSSWSDGSDAVFSGGSGTVTIAGAPTPAFPNGVGPTVNSLQFSTTGYTLSGPTVTVTGGDVKTTAALALTTINSNLIFSTTGGIIANNGTNSGHVMTLNGTIDNGGNTLTVSDIKGIINLNGTISGSGALVAGGTNAVGIGINLNSASSNSNSFTGNFSINNNVTVNASSIAASGVNSSLGAGNRIIFLAGGGTINFNQSSDVTCNRTIDLQNSSATDVINSNGVGGIDFSGSIVANLGGTNHTLALGGTSTSTNNKVGGNLSDINLALGRISSITKNGAGYWALYGNSTFTGTTVISAGVLNIQSDNALGSTVGGTSVTAGAALQIQGNITVGAETLSLGGTGVSNDGALRNISGTNTYGGLVSLVSAARINSDSGTLTLSNAGTITGAGLGLTIGGSGNTSVASVIGTVNGTLTKDGTGIVTLTGANTTSGLATISAGTLIIGTAAGGNWAGAATVNSGGTLKGRGTITGAVTINSGGTYSPGNSPGIQTVGSLTLNSGSNTIFEIDGGSAGNGAGFHDQIVVTGAATINGGTITPQTIFSGSSGFTPTAGQTFTVITAGSLTGQFTTVDNTGNPSGLSFIPQYTGTSVILLTSLSSLSSVASISLMNLSPNQIAVARSLDQFRPATIDSSPGRVMSDAEVIYQSLGRLTASQTPSAIDQLSPGKLQAIPSVAQSFGNQMHSMVGRQLELRRDSLPAQGNLSIYSRDGQILYEPVAEIGSESLFIPRKINEKLSFFASVNGEQGEVKPSEGRTNFDYWSASAIYGGNYALSKEWNLGLFTGYGHTDSSIGGAGGNIFYDSGKLGGYLSFNTHDWFVELSSSVGKGFYETKRNITFLSETAKGETEGWESVSELKMGKDWSYGKWTFRPSIMGRYSRTFVDAYNEKGSAARLHLGAMDQDSLASGAGLAVQRAIPLGKESLVPRVYTNYEREWIRSSSIDARFAAGGDSFTVHTDPIDPDSLTAGIGTTWLISERLQWDLSYEQEVLQNDLQRQSVNLNCKFSF